MSTQLGIDAINYSTKIKLRAERRMGQILCHTPKNEGGRPPEKTPSAAEGVFESPTLSDLGITYKQSSRAQKLAGVSDDLFFELLDIVGEVKGETAFDRARDAPELCVARLLRHT